MLITELPIEWRQHLTPASFRQAIFQFHVESGGKASGRRVAIHEFPKRNEPYTEDMGRKVRKWTVQGYIIISPFNTDYIPQRDALVEALEADGPGWLKLPTFEPELVMVDGYTCEESREKGGFVTFNMTFCERGRPVAYDVQEDTSQQVSVASNQAQHRMTAWIDFRFLNMLSPRDPKYQIYIDIWNRYVASGSTAVPIFETSQIPFFAPGFSASVIPPGISGAP
jgi:prophage DNA circulation protein